MKKFEPEETKSADILAEKIEQLMALFPEALTEGKIDFQVLKQLLGSMVDEREEKYGLNWHGKRRARQLALTPSTGTLRPCPEDSVDWDTTQNLMIEGDNLEVLKLLQKSYAGKVKLIYIDPPYNTGKDFVYPDDFQDNIKNYLELTGQVEGGRKISSNTEASGRFHTEWLNMMYPRLKLARNLLREDGVIFVSIADHEVHNLRLLMNEVFGEENFIAAVIWQKIFSPKNSARHFSEDHDYLIVYARNAEIWTPHLLPRTEDMEARYSNPDNDPRGPWTSGDLSARNYYSEGTYLITGPSGRQIEGPPPGTYWRVSKGKFDELDHDKRIWWGAEGNNVPRLKRFLSEVQEGRVPQTLWTYQEAGHTQEAKKELIEAVAFPNSDSVFETPKPTRLIRRMLQLATRADENALVLDFFAGSGSTLHGIFAQNAEDGGNRRCILVQLPEPLPGTDSGVLKTISDITKERLRRAGKKIGEEFSSPQRGEAGRGAERGAGTGAGTGAGRGAKAGSTTEDLWLPTPVPAGLLEAARNLRKNMTDAEQLLWQCLRGKQLDGYKFRKQHPIERYVLDFYCPSKKLAVELDGGQHNTEEGKAADVERTGWLNQQGIKVLRFWNHELLTNISGVIQIVWDALHDILPPPQPSPAGGGSLKLDLGFRVFKLDTTNIRAWEPDRENLPQTLLDSVEHLKANRSEADVLYELLLKLGLDLCVPMEKRTVAGKTVHSIGAGTLLVCLAPQIDREAVEPLALGIVEWYKTLAPAGESTVVFRDSAFADDVAKTNLAAILQQHGLGNVRSL